MPGLLAGMTPDMLAASRVQRGAAQASHACPARPARPGTQGTRPRPGLKPYRRRRTGAVTMLAACLAAAAIIGSLAVGFWPAPAPAGRRPAASTLSGVNPATHVSATAALTATTWGTSIRLRIRGVPRNVRCRLIARSRTGGTEVTGVWDAWRQGTISVPASAAWRPSDIAGLQVMTGTRTLVTMQAAGQSARAGGPFGGPGRAP